ncbi:MAG: restriction endonuclease [Caldilineaceae bacterium]
MPVKLSRLEHIEIPKEVDLTYVDKLTPRQFENFVGVLLKTRGFDGVGITPMSGDNGVDVIAHKNGKHYAIQTKLYSGKVGAADVHEPIAGLRYYNCQAAMVVTNSYFTKPAKEYASKVECELIDRDILKRWLYEYRLVTSPSAANGVWLQLSRHPNLLTIVVCVAVFVLLSLLFAAPLCEILC